MMKLRKLASLSSRIGLSRSKKDANLAPPPDDSDTKASGSPVVPEQSWSGGSNGVVSLLTGFATGMTPQLSCVTIANDFFIA